MGVLLLLVALLAEALASSINGQHIVVFKTSASASQRAHHLHSLREKNEEILFVYDFKGFAGYAGRLSNATILAARADPVVAYTEEDHEIHLASCHTEAELPAELWGQSRVSTRHPVNIENVTFTYNASAGANVDVYVIDVGVQCDHSDFLRVDGEGSRCRGTFSSCSFEPPADEDTNGHGTSVAGLAAGTRFGMCKLCEIISVKAICRGSGTIAPLIMGIQWVAEQDLSRPSVATMAFGGGFSQAVNDAVDALISLGVTAVAASGNSNADAATFSPASVERAITVNAMTVDDERSSFSNWGASTDIFVPGTMVTSSWIGAPDGSRTLSGTSMSVGFAAGVSAVLLGEQAREPDALKQHLLEVATADVIADTRGSPNKLLFATCVDEE